jgi:hypothetical protein
MNLLPIALYWGFALTGLFSPKPVLLWLFFMSLPFGSMVVVPTNLTAGLSLTPQSMTAMLIVVHELLLRRSGPVAFAALALRGPGLALFLFWIVGIVVTLLAPRLFAGQIEVVPMNASGLGFMVTSPLAPTKQNFSQLAYITVSVFSVFAFARIFCDGERLRILMRGIMITGVIVIVTGLLDFATTYVPIEPLLQPFRTVEYAILDSATIGNKTKRVIGLMPEASSYDSLVSLVVFAQCHAGNRNETPCEWHHGGSRVDACTVYFFGRLRRDCSSADGRRPKMGCEGGERRAIGADHARHPGRAYFGSYGTGRTGDHRVSSPTDVRPHNRTPEQYSIQQDRESVLFGAQHVDPHLLRSGLVKLFDWCRPGIDARLKLCSGAIWQHGASRDHVLFRICRPAFDPNHSVA